MIPLPDLARLVEMRRLRGEGWSYRKIAEHCRLSPERTEQLLKRDAMKARAYGPWVVFNDIPFLVLCRPNKEARMKAYMREYNREHRPLARLDDGIPAYWRCLVLQYLYEKGGPR